MAYPDGEKVPGLQGFFRLLLISLIALPLFGLDPSLSIFQLDRSNRPAESILGRITCIAQTPDGYLWLGSSRGLLRFDGFEVKTFVPPTATASDRGIRDLFADRTGALWMTGAAGIAVFRSGEFKTVTFPDGAPIGPADRIRADSQGAIWATSVAGRLVSINPATLKAAPTLGNAGSPIRVLFLDSHGQFWLGTQTGVCVWEGAKCASSFTEPLQTISLGEDEQGHLIIGSANKGLWKVENGRVVQFEVKAKTRISPRFLMKDRDGALWIGTLGQGILRCRRGQVESFTRSDGLSSDLVEAIYEDRHGSIWVGTSDGINRFRNPVMPRYTTREGLSGEVISTVQATRNGAIWIGTVGAGLNRLDTDRNRIAVVKGGLPGSTVTSMHEDERGRLWVGTTNGLAVWNGREFAPVTARDGTILKNVFSIAESSGTIWILENNNSLLRTDEAGHFVPYATPLPVPGHIYRIAKASAGGIWAGLYEGGVLRIDENGTEYYGQAKGIASGPVLAVQEDAAHALWVGTATGVTRIRNHHCETWALDLGVQTFLDDSAGGRWFVTPNSLLHADISALTKASGANPIVFDRASVRDRVLLGNGICATTPRISLDSGGRMWLGTDEGLLEFDTGKRNVRSDSPATVIEGMTVDGKSLNLSKPGGPVFRGNELKIQYTGFNDGWPEQLEFRYMLRGFENDWSDAGTGRQAIFTNLRQGSYTFCVAARDRGGEWESGGACQSFQIEPAYYESRVFAGACIVAGMMMLGLFHTARMRSMRSRFALVLQERVRIARELHDTLLQGFSGVTYQLEAAYRQMKSRPDASAQILLRSMDLADQSIAEARQAISLLRLSGLEGKSLSAAIASAGEEFTVNTDTRFNCTSKGLNRSLPYDVEASVYMVACEAIRNALKHANPANIAAELNVSVKGLRLMIADDGAGFDCSAPARSGHFGMKGMKERIASIGGSVSVFSSPGQGTRVEIVVPGHRIFLTRRSVV